MGAREEEAAGVRGLFRARARLAEQVEERGGLVLLAAGEEGQAEPVAERRLGVEAHHGGAAQPDLRELGELRRHRRAEEERLPLLRQPPPDVPDLLGKTHLEEAVGLVEDRHLHGLQGHPLNLGEVVEEAPGRRDEDVRVRRELGELSLEGVAADEEAEAEVGELGEVRGELVGLADTGRTQGEEGRGGLCVGARTGRESRVGSRGRVEGREGREGGRAQGSRAKEEK